MSVRQYSVRELRRIISESASEFKPVMGKNVENDNKKINDKAYSEASKKAKSFDGGLTDRKKSNIPEDDNRGMQDLEYDNISKDFQDRVKSQIKGFASVDAEKKHSKDAFGNAEFDTVNGLDDKNKKLRTGKEIAKEIGLTSSHIDKKAFKDQSHSIYESEKMFKLKFKNTVFLTENHMLSKVPDDFKVNGKKFIMKDKLDNEYIVEWNETPNIVSLSKINEEKNRIKELFNYKSNESSTSSNSRLTENNKVNDMLDKARKLMQ